MTHHALLRFWLRIDPIPGRVEVEERIKSELKRGFFLKSWRLTPEGQPILCARCSGMKVVIAPQDNCWTVLTLMEGNKRGRNRRFGA